MEGGRIAGERERRAADPARDGLGIPVWGFTEFFDVGLFEGCSEGSLLVVVCDVGVCGADVGC